MSGSGNGIWVEVDLTMEARRFVAERAVQRLLPAFFYRLSARAQRTYLKSDSIDRYAMSSDPAAVDLARDLMRVLQNGALSTVTAAANALGAELCRSLRVPPVRIDVRGVRPHNARGELHGIFYVRRPPLIVLWMHTAKHHAVVKPRTFLRTLLHELGHYFDYSVLRLEDSLHTSGFFKRESFLVRMLCPPEKDHKPEEASLLVPVARLYPPGESPLANWLRNWKHSDA